MYRERDSEREIIYDQEELPILSLIYAERARIETPRVSVLSTL